MINKEIAVAKTGRYAHTGVHPAHFYQNQTSGSYETDVCFWARNMVLRPHKNSRLLHIETDVWIISRDVMVKTDV